MPILVDYREGSKDLAKSLPGSEVTTLDYGDISFMGCGPNSQSVCIGIEYKRLSDVLKCICDGRFAGHQLPGMLKSYDRVYLLVEGIWRLGAHGQLEVLAGKDWKGGRNWKTAKVGARAFTYADLEKWLSSMEEFGGVRVRKTSIQRESVQVIMSLYQYWQNRYEKHRAHLQFDGSADGAGENLKSMFIREPSIVQRYLKEAPGVGWMRALEAAKYFGTMRNAVNGGVKEWEQVPGIGKTTAQKVVNSFDEEF